jgi:amino acid adenylation domain-containing protein
MTLRSDGKIADSHRISFQEMRRHLFVAFAREEIYQSIANRFEQVVARYPARLAVKDNDVALTFDALNRMANRIARVILSETGEKNEPVTVLVENDAITIASILAVLKSGKIYVPLDCSFSRAWSTFILGDTKATLMLCRKRNISRAQDWANDGQKLFDVDSLDMDLSDENLGLKTSPDAVAHILYTSGSTAHPKGVMDSHRNTLHYVMRLTNISHISADDRVTLVRPASSSGALMNLYVVLLNGACLFPIEIKQAGLQALSDWLRCEKISVFHAGATVFRHLAQQLTGQNSFPDLRLIRLSSGQVFKSDVDLFKQHFPDSLLLHVLSSTEANTYRAHFIKKDTVVADGPIPVGYGIEDMEILILDESGREVEVNSVGEIAIRSAYLFPGYWNSPALSEAAFLPYSDLEGRRIFRTGDLGRLRSDGCLEYLGRKDFRLKIRGHSIQTEEVELALLKIPEIAQAAVAARKDDHGDDRLTAYIVPNLTPAPTVSHMRDLLKEVLPDYMIPSSFVTLTALPVLPNGKVNRQELPLAQKVRPELRVSYAEPRSPVESVLAKIWSAALGVETVGVHDNFFELGGDSLISSKIVSHLNRIFPWNLGLNEFFSAPTVDGISKLLIAKESAPEQTDRVARTFLQIESMSAAEISRAVSDARLNKH